MKPEFLYQDVIEAVVDLRKWQRRLGLEHWKFRVVFESFDELDGNFGSVQYNCGGLIAEIALIHPQEAEREEFHSPVNHRQTLVHEMLHVLFAGMFSPDEQNAFVNRAEEQVITRLTRLLMDFSASAQGGVEIGEENQTFKETQTFEPVTGVGLPEWAVEGGGLLGFSW